MLRRILITGCLLALAAGASFAGDMHGKAHDADMAMHMKEMMNCDVCKNMAPHMESLGPVMTMDFATLNDGIAMIHGISDPAKLDEYREMSAQMDQAGEACMMLSDEEAETHLCGMCQGMRSAVQAGARMSQGDTSMGCVTTLTSEDPAVQKQLQELGTMCKMMMESM
ncbi:hypothetical protein K8I85_08700 [bacterium]|nr:hypothetical protein [bacterium]